MKFNISGHEVNVRFDQSIEESNLMGYFSPLDNEIVVTPNMTEAELSMTILHEFLHAVYHLNHFGQTKIEDDVQELLIEHFVHNIFGNFTIRSK